MQRYVTDRLNLTQDEIRSQSWLEETVSAVMDRLAARSPNVVLGGSRVRVRQALIGLLEYRRLGFRYDWQHFDSSPTRAPNRWAYLNELIAVFLRLPPGGFCVWPILYHAPTHTRFRWVVQNTSPTRKRKRNNSDR